MPRLKQKPSYRWLCKVNYCMISDCSNRVPGPVTAVLRATAFSRILQLQIAVVCRREVKYQAAVVIVFGNIRQIDELLQRSAGNRIGCCSALHLTAPLPCKRGFWI